MEVFKCKMCGDSLHFAEGATVAECESCGTLQTIPRVQNENLQGLFNRANMLRRKSEFDKAEQIYERIVQADGTQAEAYWGLILCKFGIEYVEDPTTFKRVPTCHRTSLESVLADEDYQSALKYADVDQRRLYEAEAKEIDRLQREIIAMVRNEEPYDVFICYKETDRDGKRTRDSVIANEIYHQLTLEGLKVFYAAITLEDKLGSAYEPCIFAALNSARVMLVIGTRPEYFEAVWVKNEWSRFLKMLKKDRSKLLIPCYKDMDPYELPEAFAYLQAQDMNKIGFVNDVIRGIKKVMQAATSQPVVQSVVQPVVQNTPQANTGNIVQLILEDNSMYEGEVFANIPHGYGKKTYGNGDVYEGNWNQGKRHGQGKMTWKKGGQWVGEFQDDKLWTGQGTVIYSSGDVYEGEYVNNKCHGHGKYVWVNGEIYEGDFVDGQRQGYGKNVYTSNHVYEGNWKENKRHGQGKMTWAKGGQWVGEFQDDKLWTGQGTVIYSSGDVYEGEYVNNKCHGSGKYVYASGNVYEGNWKQGNRHGQGKMTWAKGGRQWIGEFQNDEPWTGQGTVHYESGAIYEGDYVNGHRHGSGKYVYASGNVYEGNWQQGKRHGQGKIIWIKGASQWVGEWQDDEPWTGQGTMHYGNGVFEGSLLNNERHGHGKYVWASGNIYEGNWERNKCHGQGKETWAKGGQWVGEWQDNEPWTGQGTIHYDNGDVYEGSLLNSKRHGHGKYVWASGAIYEGDFVNGKKHGFGKNIYVGGNIYEGNWERDKCHGQGKKTWAKGGEWNGTYKDGVPWNGKGIWYFSETKEKGRFVLGKFIGGPC